jgi:DNA-binding CsgD family transcriptional regulator
VEALTMSLIGEAEVAARTGQLATALELSDRAGELTELVALGATHKAVVRFFVLLHLDRARDADDCRRELDALLDVRDEGIARIWLLHLEGITHLGLGRPEAAASVYLKAERLTERLGIGEPCVIPWAGRAAIAHARAGNDTDAARVLDWLDDCASRLPCRYPHVAAALGRAELAIRHADHRAAEGHYIDALAIHDTAELPMERISTLLAYGDMLRRTGEPARARPVLAEALDRAETLQAPAHARYAREALSSTGGRRRRGLQSGRLTPQELRVAELARVGNSRREIAEQLTVSEATVRTHLQHIYSKLGIHSLRELMVADATVLVGDEIDGRHLRNERRAR